MADLVPEGDLSGVPPGDPCCEEPLHVAQEHHPIHSVVFAVCLLVGTETIGEPGPQHVVLYRAERNGSYPRTPWNQKTRALPYPEQQK